MNAPAKILVVDDTPRNVKLLADLLTVKGYAVVTAVSGREALAQVETQRPDLVLLDVVMPEMSGYEVCRKLREDSATVCCRWLWLRPSILLRSESKGSTRALMIFSLSRSIKRNFLRE